MMKKKTLGLIAGNGQFPLLFARKAKVQDYLITAAAIRGDTSFLLKFCVDRIQWFKAGELGKLFQYFQQEGISQAIMAGQVNPENLFEKNMVLDETFRELFKAIEDRKADTIFAAVADQLKQHGVELIDSTFLLKENLAPKGTLTKRGPTVMELADIGFGRTIAKQMGEIDVGQTVVVKDKAIVAIEAMEGTDQTILRGGRISQGGAVVVKMSKPDQDFRFDVPVIGPKTVKTMICVGAKCLAIESQKTIIIDQKSTLTSADKAGIAIIAV